MTAPHDNRSEDDDDDDSDDGLADDGDFRDFTDLDGLTERPDAEYVDPSDLVNAVRITSPSPLSQSPPPSTFMTLAMVLDGWTPPSTPVAVSVCGWLGQDGSPII